MINVSGIAGKNMAEQKNEPIALGKSVNATYSSMTSALDFENGHEIMQLKLMSG